MDEKIWGALEVLRAAVEWIVSDLQDAGVEFEHIENIEYFLSEAENIIAPEI